MPDYKFIVDAGVILPDTSQVLDEVKTEWKNALGDDLDVAGNTPQGMLIAAETAGRKTVIENNVALANQINPNLAGGIFLDALCALTGLRRTPATYSTLTGVIIGGASGTIIQAGERARIGSDGAIFRLLESVIIGPDGKATGTFQAAEAGPIICDVGALDTPLVGGLLGWETVSNPTAAIIGDNVQSDASLRAKRRRTLALQGRSMPEAIQADLIDLPGVLSLQFRENVSNETATIDGIELPGHSVWTCVYGGDENAIARAMLNSKSAGARWAGDTAVDVVDTWSGQTYTVRFDRPDVVDVKVRVTLSIGTAVADPFTAIPAAIVAYADGDGDSSSNDFGEPAFRVGEDISPFEIAWAINAVYPGFVVRKVEVARNTQAYPDCPSVLPIAIREVPRITTSLVTVVVV